MFKDEVINHITISLSFADRLRVLFGRKIRVRVFTKTENLVGEVDGSSAVTIDRFRLLKREIGYEALPDA
ncbi:MAG: hypothetical protein KAX98_10635 [Nitrospira sp.]|nr:hypothetical protein [Nitrospira sp.]